MTPSTRAEICRAALCEAGRPDLAALIGTNRVGNPMRPHPAIPVPDALLVARAFQIAHVGNPNYTQTINEQIERFTQQADWEDDPVEHWSPMQQNWAMDYYDDEWVVCDWGQP